MKNVDRAQNEGAPERPNRMHRVITLPAARLLELQDDDTFAYYLALGRGCDLIHYHLEAFLHPPQHDFSAILRQRFIAAAYMCAALVEFDKFVNRDPTERPKRPAEIDVALLLAGINDLKTTEIADVAVTGGRGGGEKATVWRIAEKFRDKSTYHIDGPAIQSALRGLKVNASDTDAVLRRRARERGAFGLFHQFADFVSHWGALPFSPDPQYLAKAYSPFHDQVIAAATTTIARASKATGRYFQLVLGLSERDIDGLGPD